MDTKRLILAIGLSIIVITVYQYFFMPKPVPPAQQPTEQAGQATPGGAQEGTPDAVQSQTAASQDSKPDIYAAYPDKKPVKVEAETFEQVQENMVADAQKDIVVETDLFTAVFTNEGAALKSFVLKKYKDDKKNPLDLVSSRVNDLQRPLYPFHFSPGSADSIYKKLNEAKYVYDGEPHVFAGKDGATEIVFKYADVESKLSVTKKFVISPGSYLLGLECNILEEGQPRPAPMVFGPDLENNINAQRNPAIDLKICHYDGSDSDTVVFSSKAKDINILDKSKHSIEMRHTELGRNFIWTAYERTYFAAIFKTQRQVSNVGYTILREHIPGTKESKEKDNIYSYLVVENPTAVYMGPKDGELLDEIAGMYPNVEEVIEYGFFGAIAKILLKGINLVYSAVPNYGWAIVIFTIFLKLVLFPLTYASTVSMAKMQALQPKIKAIQKKYKNQKDMEQRRKMNEEVMGLYKSEKVNPASGCLPILLQIPFFFAFFSLLRTCINVRHEPWILWISDLSLKDSTYIIPVLMAITQLLVSKMSPTGAEGAQKKIMIYAMPAFMFFIFMNLSSGLVLYFLVSNILQVGQQYFINNRVFQQKKEEEKLRKAQKRKKGVKKI